MNSSKAKKIDVRPLRSWLFTPATRPERFENAFEAGADALIIDLEDAVSPADKDSARKTAFDYLQSRATETGTLALRINGLDTIAGINDLHGLLNSAVDPEVIVLPKASSFEQIGILVNLLSVSGKSARLIAIIETAESLAQVEKLAHAPKLLGLMFGAADMAADLGAATTWEGLIYARQRLIAAAASSDILPIDAPFFDIHDSEGGAKEVQKALEIGFRAKAAIHPRHLEAINHSLTPSADAVEQARKILAENQKGVGVVDGKMIDEAVARKARRTLSMAGVD
jgi:(S)-citramalyl-CoA lyase